MGLFSRADRPDVEDLRSIALFASLTDDELAAVAKLAVRKEVAADEVLIDQGRFGDSFYVISEGRANVYMNGDYLASVGPDSAVGEASLLEHRPRNASVVAEQDMVVAEFGLTEFNKLLDNFPSARIRIAELLSARVKENTERTGPDAD